MELTATEEQILKTCDPRLVQLVKTCLLRGIPLKVICGHRGEAAQKAAHASGHSENEWGQSKHNLFPSLAVDLAPAPVMYPQETDSRYVYAKKMGRFYLLAGMVLMIAAEINIHVRFGGDWDQDKEIMDEKFDDLGHIEIVGS